MNVHPHQFPRRDTVPMSRAEINALRLASKLDRLHVDPDDSGEVDTARVCSTCLGEGVVTVRGLDEVEQLQCQRCEGRGIVSHG